MQVRPWGAVYSPAPHQRPGSVVGVCPPPPSTATPSPHRAHALREELKICRYCQHHVREIGDISL